MVEKEHLHYEILRALDEAAVLDKLVSRVGPVCGSATVRRATARILISLEQRVVSLPEILHGKDFAVQMTRFLPPALIQRTIAERDFLDYLVSANQSLLERVREAAES